MSMPVSMIDASMRMNVVNLFLSIKEEYDTSFLYITHDLATVKAVADEIVVMLQGRIVEQGIKKDILTPPHHEYTDLLLSSVPEMDPDWLTDLLKRRAAAGVV